MRVKNILFILLFILMGCTSSNKEDVKSEIISEDNIVKEESSENIISEKIPERKVKKITIKEYSVEEKFGEPIYLLDKVTIYNIENDFKTIVSNYDSLGSPYESEYTDFRTILKNDEQGNLISSLNYNTSGDLVDGNSWNLTYDSNRNVIQREIYNHLDKLESIVKLKYDSNNNEIRTVSYNIKGEVESIQIYEYDENNNVIKNISYFDSENLENFTMLKQTYQDGILIESMYECNHDCLILEYVPSKTSYKYDTDGILIEELRFDKDGNGYGGVKNKYFDDEYESYSRVVYKKSNQGNYNEEVRYQIDGKIFSSRYQSSKIVQIIDPTNDLNTKISYLSKEKFGETIFIPESKETTEYEYFD